MRIELPRYTPLAGKQVAGVFLMDSFGYLKDSDYYYWYMPDALEYVYMRTNVLCCRGGMPGSRCARRA
jgi:hypothetical protein